MTRHDATLRMEQRVVKALQLPLTRRPAILTDCLGQPKHCAGISRVTVRQHAAMGIYRQITPRPGRTTGQQLARSALFTKAKVLQLYEQRWRKAIVELGEINIFRRNARLGKGGLS